jgi:hypothetical protein
MPNGNIDLFRVFYWQFTGKIFGRQLLKIMMKNGGEGGIRTLGGV